MWGPPFRTLRNVFVCLGRIIINDGDAINAKIPKSFSDLKFLNTIDFEGAGITGLPDFSGLTKLTYVRKPRLGAVLLEGAWARGMPSTDAPWRPHPLSAATWT